MRNTFTLLLLLGFMIVNAQNKMRLGLKGGLNISTVTVRNVNLPGDICTKAGFHIGGLLAIPIAKNFEFHPELLYSNQGYKYKDSNAYSKYEEIGNINYIAVPVMFAYYPTKKFNIEIGPQFSFLVSHKVEVSYRTEDIDDIDFDGTIDLEDKSQSIEAGINIGAGYKITSNIFVSGRYNFGITTVNKKEKGINGSDQENRNSVFQLSLGYLFN